MSFHNFDCLLGVLGSYFFKRIILFIVLVLNSKFGLWPFVFLRDYIILWAKHLKLMKGIKKRFISFEFKNEIIEETEFEIKSMYAFGKKLQHST